MIIGNDEAEWERRLGALDERHRLPRGSSRISSSPVITASRDVYHILTIVSRRVNYYHHGTLTCANALTMDRAHSEHDGVARALGTSFVLVTAGVAWPCARKRDRRDTAASTIGIQYLR